MAADSCARRPSRSVGAFLCIHPRGAPVEDIDRPSPLDVKQQAALRAVIALRKLGKEVSDDAIVAFDAEPKLVALAYRWAARDALKRHLGRGKDPRPALERDRNEVIPDRGQEEALAAVEDDAAAELQRLYDCGIEGLTLDQTRRVLALMRHIQELKDGGATQLPVALRQRLSRLRRETRLPLDITLL